MSWSSWNPVELLAPKICLVCGQDSPNPICTTCLNFLETLESKGCRRCGNPSVHSEALECWWCQRLDYLPDHLVSCFAYRETGKAVYQLIKFKYYWRLVFEMAERFVSCFLASNAFLEYECVCPIPETAIQKFRRPFHPAGLIADMLVTRTGIPRQKLLRVGPLTQRQVGLDLVQRRENLKGKFKVRKMTIPRSALLVDDVITTGTTLESASLVLKHAGVSHIGWFTLFRTV